MRIYMQGVLEALIRDVSLDGQGTMQHSAPLVLTRLREYLERPDVRQDWMERLCVRFPKAWDDLVLYLTGETSMPTSDELWIIGPFIDHSCPTTVRRDVNLVSFLRQFFLTWKRVGNVQSNRRKSPQEEFESLCHYDRAIEFGPSVGLCGITGVPRAPRGGSRRYFVERLVGSGIYPHPASVIAQTLDSVFATFMEDFQAFRPYHIVGCHGPGVVCDTRGDKYTFPTWSKQLDAHFPFEFHGRHISDDVSLEKYQSGDLEVDAPSTFKLVPKSYAKDRGIAIETAGRMFVQKGIDAWMRSAIREGSWLRHSVDLTSQEPNGRAALHASSHGELATVDLRQASDSLSTELVIRAFGHQPPLCGALLSSRSLSIKHGDRTHRLRKYATMGNGTTFVVQSVIFAGFAAAAVLLERNGTNRFRFSRKELRKSLKVVQVFGDDIILPTDAFSTLADLLSRFGVAINPQKSYADRKFRFRESCGVDALEGCDITPAYAKAVPLGSESAAEQISLIEFSNKLFEKGWWQASRASLENWAVPTNLAVRGPADFGFGLRSFTGTSFDGLPRRWNRRYQRVEVRARMPSTTTRRIDTEGLPRLYRYLVQSYSDWLDWKSWNEVVDLAPIPYEPSQAARSEPRLRLGWIPTYEDKEVL